jgi:hypothetical protein
MDTQIEEHSLIDNIQKEHSNSIIQDKRESNIRNFIQDWISEIITEVELQKLPRQPEQKATPQSIRELLDNLPEHEGTLEVKLPSMGVLCKDKELNCSQIMVLYQHDKVSCGYFALYFAVQILRCIKNHSKDWDHLLNRPAFYYYKNKWMNLLRTKAISEGLNIIHI